MGKRKTAAPSTRGPVPSGGTEGYEHLGGGIVDNTAILKLPVSSDSPEESASPKAGRNGGSGRAHLPAHRIKTSIEGLKELLSLLEQVGPESGLTFLYSQHLDPKDERKLRKLLGLRHRPVAVSNAPIRAELRNKTRELKDRTNELNELRDELASIFSTIHLPVIVVGKDLRIRFAADAAKALLSARFADSERRITETMLAIHVPDLKNRILQVIETSQTHEQDFQDEDGHWKTLSVQPLIRTHKSVDAVVLTVDDIDTQRNTELILRGQEKITRGLFESVNGILTLIDKNQQIELINKKGCQLLACDEQSVIGRDWFDTFIPETTRAEVRKLFAQLIAGGTDVPDEIETPVVTRNGDLKTILWRYAVITDDSGAAVGVLGSGQDVTAWRNADAALRGSEEWVRLILKMENADEFFIVDPNGNILSWMAGTELGKKMRGEEVVGKHFSSFYPPEDFVAGRPMRTLTQADSEGRCEENGWWLANDGSQHRANIIVIPIRNPDGTLRGFSTIVHYLGND